MEILCTRPQCSKPKNFFSDLSNKNQLKTTPQRYCTNCGMPLILADRYLPEKLLGQGGFGAAFLARDRYSPKFRYCVVKQFKPSGHLSSQELIIARDLFTREGEVLEELGNQHPQIPDLFAFFTPIIPRSDGTGDEQYFYLVQEYINGQDLESIVKEKGELSEVEVIKILQEVLKILEFIHQKNVIHRDIKPSNIMRDRNGVIYLLDFGAVKQIASGNGSKKSTGIYSMGFAPPEQMRGETVYPATDLYALAVTCLILLTGKTTDELYDNFNNSWQWRKFVKVSDRFRQILDKMLLETASKRFQSATEILALLNPLVSVKPTPPIAPKPQKVPSRFSLIEVLGSAAFTGFEGGLLAIILTNIFTVSGISIGILGATIAGLIYAQTRRFIEKIDLGIIAGITVGIIYFFPGLQGEFILMNILIIAVMSGATAIAVTAFFRLVYQLLKRIL